MPLSTRSKKKAAAKQEAPRKSPEVVASKKTDPSPKNANPPAKTDGQRKPDHENFNPDAGKSTGVPNDNPPAKTRGQRMPDVVSENPAPAENADWQAKKSFTYEFEGKLHDFVKNETRVPHGSAILAGIEHLFEQVK